MTARTVCVASLLLIHSALVAPAFGQLSGTIDAADIGGAVPGVSFLGIDHLSLAGFSVSSAGDVNGDGLADMLIGAPHAAPNGKVNAGETYVIYGSASLAGSFDLADADVTFRGINADDGSGFVLGDESGYAVSSAGDVNGDGFADLLIGAPYAAPNGTFSAGESYLVYGSANLAGSFDLTAADVTFRGIDLGRAAGFSVSSAGDVNGDGLADLLIGADRGIDDAGRAYLIYGAATLAGGLDLSEANVTFFGIDRRDAASYSVSSAGDVNGDGLADLLFGASGAGPNGVQGAGGTYLVFGRASLAGSFDLGEADVIFSGVNRFDQSGSSVSSAGDVNGDGFADLLIGAYPAERNGDSYVGEAYLVYGGPGLGGHIDLSAADVIFPGNEAYGSLGASVSSAGDVNGDGLADLLIRATEKTYLIYGSESLAGSFEPAMADVIFSGISSSEEAGHSLASAGDVNGDGLADLLIGASGVNGGTGGAYLVYGQRPLDPSMPGDIDGDLDVDGRDLLLIQRGLGTTYQTADVDEWRENFGRRGSANAVPEPTSLALAGLVVLNLTVASRRQPA